MNFCIFLFIIVFSISIPFYLVTFNVYVIIDLVILRMSVMAIKFLHFGTAFLSL
jgi:hypothetical protein